MQYYAIVGVVKSDFWVAHTNAALAEIEATVSALRNCEAVARAYALSGEIIYLNSLQDAVANAYKHERTLRQLTSDNPRQQRRLSALEPMLARRFELLNQLVTLRREAGINRAAEFASSPEGNLFIAEIRTTCQELEAEEYVLFKLRVQEVESSTKRALAVVLSGTLAGLALVAVASIIIHAHMTKRQRLEQELTQEKHLLSTLLDNIPDSVYFKDTESRFTRINKALARWIGIGDPLQATGKTDAEFFTEQHAQAARADELEIMRSGLPILDKEERETWIGRPDTWVTTSKLPLYDTHGVIVGTFGISRNITARKQAEEALEDANSKLTGWVDELESRNRESLLLTELGELLQTSISEEEAHNVLSKFAPPLFHQRSGALCVINVSHRLLETVATWGGKVTSETVFEPDQCWALRRGRLHHASRENVRLNCGHVPSNFEGAYVCVPMMAQGEALGILHLTSDGSAEDFTDSELRLAGLVAERVAVALANLKLREALRAQSIRDPLTGLFNRRYMEESLERELRRAERNRKPVGAIMIDLDHFKNFNDTFGHDAGDHLLREFGKLLQCRTRKEDIACRYGGEEFMVILPDAKLEDTYHRAEELLDAVRHLNLTSRGKSLGVVTCSMGVALYPDHATTVAGLLRAADEALYQAKTQGRDRVLIAMPVYT